MAKSPANSPFRRSLKLFGMASKVAGKEILQKISGATGKDFSELSVDQFRRRIEQAQTLTDTLKELKGAAMKAGQLLSIDASQYLPPEAQAILSELQDQAEALDFQEIEKILEREWQTEWPNKVQRLSPEPIASASIGQVHSAFRDEKKLAIKIQYPGVANSIDSDLRLLKKVASLFTQMAGKEVDLDEVFKELSLVLQDEADYLREMRCLEAFGSLLKEDHRYVVPKFFPELSTARVLAMSFEEGITITRWLTTRPDLEIRKYYAELILDLYIREFVEFGIVQTDPNFANFLIRQNTRELVLLDFGATRIYDVAFRKGYAQVLKIFRGGSREEIFQAVVDFELLDAREPTEAKELFAELLNVSMRPFDPARQPFDFKDQDFEKDSRDIAIKFTKSLKYSSPPRKVLFLHRKLGGVFNLLKRFEVVMDLAPYWDRMTNPDEILEPILSLE